MRRPITWSTFAVVALAVMLTYTLAFAAGRDGGMRDDCPGKVVCPLTGEEVCKDRCPLAVRKTDAMRADCPGQIECPLTGEWVCRDQCPANDAAKPVETKESLASEEDSDLPPCCRNLKK